MLAGIHLLRRLKFLPPSPSSFFFFFWFSTFSAKKRTKALLCLKFGHKQKYLKGASEHLVHECVLFLQGRGKLSKWLLPSSTNCIFLLCYFTKVPPFFFFFLACVTALPLKPEAVELSLYKEFKTNSESCFGEETSGVHYSFCYFIVFIFVCSHKWGFLRVVLHKVWGRQHIFLRNFKIFLKVQQVDGREVHSIFIICIHTYITYT